MSIKIRPIKCPNCGSEKHDQLNEKLYRCKNCGTEYFLDDDDITVHVKHDFSNDKKITWYFFLSLHETI